MKKTGILILAVMLLGTACARKGADGQESAMGKKNSPVESVRDGEMQSGLPESTSDAEGDTPGSLAEASSGMDATGGRILTAVSAEEPLWAQVVQSGGESDGTLYTGLNLDGVGEADDEVYVSIYSLGDMEGDRVTVLRIHLGTGETMAHVFSVYGDFRLQTGRLFSPEKEAVLLEIKSPRDNGLEASVFVVDVSPADGNSGMPKSVLRLDTTRQPVVLDQGTLVSNTMFGTEIIDIEDSSLQGLHFHAGKWPLEDGTYAMANYVICWGGEDVAGWTQRDEYESAYEEYDGEKDSNAHVGMEEPLWAQCTQEGALFEGLNLDGIGEVDDAVYVSSYCFGDYKEEAVTVLWVHLGTGETQAEVLPVYGDISLRAGRLHLYGDDRGDDLLLGISDGQDGNGETAVYSVNVFPARHFSYDPYPLPFFYVNRDDDEFFLPASEDEEPEADVLGDAILDVDIKMDAEGKELFRQVLLGETPLLYVPDRNPENVSVAPYFVPYVSDGARAVNITDIPLIMDVYDLLMDIQNFAVADLDGDGEDEVILFVCGVAGDMSGKVILHRMGDEIYGYRSGWRTVWDLKTDGTYFYSSSITSQEDGIVSVAEFTETGYTIEKLYHATGNHVDGYTDFFVNGQPATEEEYNALEKIQDEKPDAEWYAFTEENINTIF